MKFNLLVVDDSRVMRSMIIKTVKMSGLLTGEVFQAGNGAEALDVLRDAWVDLALVDINMPVMNGEELVARMKALPDTVRVPVVVVSTEGSETRINKLREAGVEFVHKPFTPEQLRDVVLRVTGAVIDHNDELPAGASNNLDF